ncbi:MAG: histidine--tRNA ligase [Candidatus Bathyarchaeota archaeon]|nr:MAG: histidine--tRNA ligase [Candidatus Bathyarchaeota archaeon]
MRDLLPKDFSKSMFVKDKVRESFRLYGYEEIATPIIESHDLLATRAGEEIRHRLYSFKDLGGRRIALRPEVTASVSRIVATKLRSEVKPLRLGYIANCFRYDNPQMGRYREFWQAGFELFGSTKLEADAEIIMANITLMKNLGFSNILIKLGDVRILRSVLEAEGMSEEGQNVVMGLVDKRRVKRVITFLKSKKTSNAGIKTINKLLSVKGTDIKKVFNRGKKILIHNDKALEALKDLETIINLTQVGGVDNDFLVDLGFARGLEYYTGMIYEIFVPDLGIALGGGGRYDKLVKLLGGEPIPAVGCAPGIDRIVLAMEKKQLFPEPLSKTDKILVIPVNDEISAKALEIAADLRRNGICAQNDIIKRGVRSALSYASKKDYTYTIIVGTRELVKECVILRDMKRNIQKEIALKDLIIEIRTR